MLMGCQNCNEMALQTFTFDSVNFRGFELHGKKEQGWCVYYKRHCAHCSKEKDILEFYPEKIWDELKGAVQN